MTGWPFWAATSDERIEQALDLAELRAGETLLDLGCGDGRVLLRAAAFREAVVRGVELDPRLAASARALLTEHGIDGQIIEDDFASVDLEADVVFAYLSPATLQRLRGRLETLPTGTRVVTTGYAMPGWVPDAAGGRCYLYRLPAETFDPDGGRQGWASDGVLIAVQPETQSLVAVKLHHGGGSVDVRVASGDLANIATVRTGADHAEADDEVVIDVRLEPLPSGTVVVGALDSGDLSPFQVFVVADPPPGMWGLSRSGCDSVAAMLGAGEMAKVLAEARAHEPPPGP